MELKVTELRPGNLVFSNGRVRDVTPAFLCTITLRPWDSSYLKPLDLTQEILDSSEMARGLCKITEDGPELPVYCIGDFCILPGNLAALKGDDTIVAIRPLAYVHELQNLFFALTGRELLLHK